MAADQDDYDAWHDDFGHTLGLIDVSRLVAAPHATTKALWLLQNPMCIR